MFRFCRGRGWVGVEDVILFTDRLFLNQLNCLTLDRLVGGVGGGGVCDDL